MKKLSPKNSKTLEELEKLGQFFNNGNYNAMENCARSLIKKIPNDHYVWKGLSIALIKQDKSKEAEQALYKSTQLAPNDVENLNNLGVLLQNRKAWGESENILRRAHQLDSGSKDILFNLAIALMHQHKLQEACDLFTKCLALDPLDADTHCNMGCALDDFGRSIEAISHLQTAIKLAPNHASSYATLGNIIRKKGDFSEAITLYEKALQLNPNLLHVYSSLFFCLLHQPNKSVTEIFQAHTQFGMYVNAARKHAPYHHAAAQYKRKSKLRLGFVSGDMRGHAMAHFIKPIFAGLDRDQFEIFVYNNYPKEDAVSQQIKALITHWSNIFDESDVECARKINADNIDILIDLSGHTAHERLAVFAYKPAPVQMSWMGYPGTTGMNTIDYYILDAHLAPLSKMDEQFTEKLIRLPVSAPFQPYELSPDICELPLNKKGHVTFGNFSRPEKINSFTIELWHKVLLTVPGSQLLIAGLHPDQQESVRIKFQSAGIDMTRILWHARDEIIEYLNTHNEIDILLDTYPYNGATTSLYAQWMGVPTLTLTGDTVASRQGAAVMGGIGLDDFITDTPALFIDKALYWANHPSELAALRRNMRSSVLNCMARSPQHIVSSVEIAFKQAWEAWCTGQPPKAFEVTLGDLKNQVQHSAR